MKKAYDDYTTEKTKLDEINARWEAVTAERNLQLQRVNDAQLALDEAMKSERAFAPTGTKWEMERNRARA